MKRYAVVLAVAATAALLISACSRSNSETRRASSSGSAVVDTISASGYPLSRSLESFVGMNAIDDVIAVEVVGKPHPARWNTPNGDAPAYITEKRNPTTAEASVPYSIYTSFDATVSRSYYHKAASRSRSPLPPGTKVKFYVYGGRVDSVELVPEPEVGPPPSSVRPGDRLLLAGTWDPASPGKIIEINPMFMYKVDKATSTAETMVEGLLGESTSFTIADFDRRFKERSARETASIPDA